MTDPQTSQSEDADESAPNRPKWLGVLIAVFMVLVALGVFNVGRLIMRPAPAVPAQQAREVADPALAQGRSLVERGSCMSCHRETRKAVGPSFEDVAQRYHTREDALAYLLGKIRGGSVGEWGQIVMPRQPQVKEDDARLMAAWILSHAKPTADSLTPKP